MLLLVTVIGSPALLNVEKEAPCRRWHLCNAGSFQKLCSKSTGTRSQSKRECRALLRPPVSAGARRRQPGAQFGAMEAPARRKQQVHGGAWAPSLPPMSVLSASGSHLPSCSALAWPGSARLRTAQSRGLCSGAPARRREETAPRSERENILRAWVEGSTKREGAPGAPLPTAGRTAARPAAASRRAGRARTGRAWLDAVAARRKVVGALIWTQVEALDPRARLGVHAHVLYRWRRSPPGRWPMPVPPPRPAVLNTAGGSPPGRAPSLAVSAGVPSPSPVLAAVQPHGLNDSVLVLILSLVL